jgi:hypothetical protein
MTVLDLAPNNTSFQEHRYGINSFKSRIEK